MKARRCRSTCAVAHGQRAAEHVHACRKGRDHTGAHQCRVPGCKKAWRWRSAPLAVREERARLIAEHPVTLLVYHPHTTRRDP